MGKTKKAPEKAEKVAGKKRSSDAAAEAAEAEAKKARKKAKEEEPVEKSEGEFTDEGSEGSEGEDEDEDMEPTVFDKWQEQLHARAEGMGCFAVLLGDLDKSGGGSGDEGEDEDSDETEPSLEKLEAMTRIFLPKQAEEYLINVQESLIEIGSTPTESEEEEEEEQDDDPEKAAMKKNIMRMFRMRMLTTRHSYPMHSIIKASLASVDKAIKKKDWKEAFCHWTATVLAVSDEGHWYADTDAPDEVTAIYKQLKQQWGKIKKHSDKDLGNPVCEGGSAPSIKNAFDKVLAKLADNLKELDYKI